MSKKWMWLDNNTFIKMIKLASENNGHVIIESKDFSPIELKMSKKAAEKEFNYLLDAMSKNTHMSKEECKKFIERDLGTELLRVDY